MISGHQEFFSSNLVGRIFFSQQCNNFFLLHLCCMYFFSSNKRLQEIFFHAPPPSKDKWSAPNEVQSNSEMVYCFHI